jgi:hypothetical protein
MIAALKRVEQVGQKMRGQKGGVHLRAGMLGHDTHSLTQGLWYFLAWLAWAWIVAPQLPHHVTAAWKLTGSDLLQRWRPQRVPRLLG